MSLEKRNERLDFMKGIAILFVILNHNIPLSILYSYKYFYHIGQAVPIFMMVSGYLVYAKYSSQDLLENYHHFNKVFKRIMLPFAIVTMIQISIQIVLGIFNLKTLIVAGGIGPGSYYPWVFLQCTIFLPIIVFVINKFSKTYISALIIIGISIGLNILCSVLHLPEAIYRLLAIRYIFYLYLGCLWRKEGIRFNGKTVFLVILSVIFIELEKYKQVNFSPLFFNSWQGYNWLGAFYTLAVICFIDKLYQFIKIDQIKTFISRLGKSSYEIFLTQMFIFSFLSPNLLSFIPSQFIRYMIYILLTTLMSVIPVYSWKYIFNHKNKLKIGKGTMH